NLLTRPRIRERTHIDLNAPGFVRLVGDPLPVRRELAIALLERGLHDGKWLSLSNQRQRPQIEARFLTRTPIEYEPAIRRPVERLLVLRGREQELLLPDAIGRLLVQVEHTGTVRIEHDAAAVRRPDRSGLGRAVGREAVQRPPSEIQDPD